jgi:mannosyltransferase
MMPHARSGQKSELAGSEVLAWVTACSLLVAVFAMSPLANRADHLGAAMHYGQHIVIVLASIALGASVRHLLSARPLGRRGLVALGVASVVAGVAVALPPVRDAGGGFHFAQHGLVVVAAALAGMLLRELLTARRAGPTERAFAAAGIVRRESVGEAYRTIAASWLPVAAVLAVALYVRVASLGFQSLTDDEGYSFALAQRSFPDMLGLFRWEGNGTLYSVVLWPIVRISDSVDALRLPAALAGVAAVGATYWAGRELANRRIALLGALLLALSPMAVRYAQFARPFSFVLLFSALSVALLARHLRTGNLAALAGYSVVLALAAYANSLAPVLLVPVHVLLVAPAGRAALRRLAIAVAGAIALAAPVIALALVETGRRDPLYWLPGPSPGQIARVAQEFMIGRAPAELGVVRIASAIGIVATAALIAAAARKRGYAQSWRLLAWTFVPLGLALAISLVRPVFFGAYLVLALPGLCLLLATGVQRLPLRAAGGIVDLLAVAWLAADGAMGGPPRVNDYRSAVAWITAQRTAGDPVILDPITRLPGYGYYAADFRAANGDVVVKEWREQPLPRDLTGFTDPGGYGDAPAGPPTARAVERLAQRTGRLVFIIDTPTAQGDVEEGAAARWLRSHCTVRERLFGGIVVLAARGCPSSGSAGT